MRMRSVGAPAAIVVALMARPAAEAMTSWAKITKQAKIDPQ